MPPPKSKVRTYFERTLEGGTCKLCSKSLVKTQLATKYLIIQASLVVSERVFSTSGDILSAERCCIDDQSLDSMIFLKMIATSSDFLL